MAGREPCGNERALRRTELHAEQTPVCTVAEVYQTGPDREDSVQTLPNLEAGFRSVVETASDAVVLYDSHGSILVWNRAAEKMYGYAAREMLGNWFGVVVAPGLRAQFEGGLTRAITTGVLQHGAGPCESLHVRKDGTEFPVEITVALWNSGDEVFVTTIVRDITERKRAEMDMARLCSDEKRLREKLEEDIGRNAEFTRALVHELRTPLAAVWLRASCLYRSPVLSPLAALQTLSTATP